jgi:exopolyphosphatase/guanosine-5'-triphosphate,3'-diphosphate pyrophosphatase
MPAISDDRCALTMILRLAILFHRSRQDVKPPELKFNWSKTGFDLEIERDWLVINPLTKAELQSEVGFWEDINVPLKIK